MYVAVNTPGFRESIKEVNWNYKKMLYENERSTKFIKEQLKEYEKKANLINNPDYQIYDEEEDDESSSSSDTYSGEYP
jgi:hypothetical protein